VFSANLPELYLYPSPAVVQVSLATGGHHAANV
jgi:hypothetical protein